MLNKAFRHLSICQIWWFIKILHVPLWNTSIKDSIPSALFLRIVKSWHFNMTTSSAKYIRKCFRRAFLYLELLVHIMIFMLKCKKRTWPPTYFHLKTSLQINLPINNNHDFQCVVNSPNIFVLIREWQLFWFCSVLRVRRDKICQKPGKDL